MAISRSRWNDPFRGLTPLRDLNDVFTSFFIQPGAPLGWNSMPPMDVYIEDDKQLVAELQLPRFSPEDVEIRVQDDVLEIRGEVRQEVEDRDKRRNYMVRQSVARFFRRIALPQNADTDNVQAEFDDSVLRVIVPFKDRPEARRISVSGGRRDDRGGGNQPDIRR